MNRESYIIQTEYSKELPRELTDVLSTRHFEFPESRELLFRKIEEIGR